MPNDVEERIILFDGVCNLCNSSVQFVIKRDPNGEFKFASLQSKVAKDLFQKFNTDPSSFDSVVLIEKDVLYTKSAAALRIARNLPSLWPLMYVFIIIPRPIRDQGYDFISKHRYKWFGKKDQCAIPTPELQQRFLG